MKWKPIETAPKDRLVLLWFPGICNGLAACGSWCAELNHKNPRPYWRCSLSTLEIGLMRKYPPTHWCEIVQPK